MTTGTKPKTTVVCPKCGNIYQSDLPSCPECDTPAEAAPYNMCWRCGHRGQDVTYRALWKGGGWVEAAQCVNGDTCDERWYGEKKHHYRAIPGKLD